MAKDKIRIKIIDLLKSHKDGLTIIEIMKKLGLARHTILARLYSLIGEGKIKVRQINMAKLHQWDFDSDKDEKEFEKDIKNKNPVKLINLEEKHIKKKTEKKESNSKNPKIDLNEIRKEIDQELKSGKISEKEANIKNQRNALKKATDSDSKKKTSKEFVLTGIEGFDALLDKGIPKANTLLVAGGAGSGKTIFCLQLLNYQASQGKKCLYMSFEENEERLIQHMEDFGWNPKESIKKGKLKIQRFNPFDITRNVDALLAKQKGELLIDVDPIIIPEDFKPDFIVVDSLTAIASAFTEKDESYRIYIEQLFRFFEKIDATAFLITETEQVPKIFSASGVEEFLADGVIVLYSIKHGNVRENAIEILKLRGASHQKKIVAMQITDKGIIVYPEQEVFSEM